MRPLVQAKANMGVKRQLSHGISRFPWKVFPHMHKVYDRAGSWHVSRLRHDRYCLPYRPTTSAPWTLHVLHGSILGLYIPLSTLQPWHYCHRRMTRGRCGSLDLHRMTLSFTTPYRFWPALSGRSCRACTNHPQWPADICNKIKISITSKTWNMSDILALIAYMQFSIGRIIFCRNLPFCNFIKNTIYAI